MTNIVHYPDRPRSLRALLADHALQPLRLQEPDRYTVRSDGARGLRVITHQVHYAAPIRVRSTTDGRAADRYQVWHKASGAFYRFPGMRETIASELWVVELLPDDGTTAGGRYRVVHAYRAGRSMRRLLPIVAQLAAALSARAYDRAPDRHTRGEQDV